MTREEAKRLLANTPEFIPGPCATCGAQTQEEAADLCKPWPLPSGEYVCSTPDEGPSVGNDYGLLYQRNPEYDKLDGYLTHWHAYDKGLTTIEPEWD